MTRGRAPGQDVYKRQIVAYIDNDTVGETYDIFYFDTTGSNPAKYTVANKWDASGGDWKGDVAAMRCV